MTRRILALLWLCLLLGAGCSQQPAVNPEVVAYLKQSDQQFADFQKQYDKFFSLFPKLEAATDRATPEELRPLELFVKEYTALANDYEKSLDEQTVPEEAKAYHQHTIERLTVLRELSALEFKRMYVGNPFHKDYFEALEAIKESQQKVQASLNAQRVRLVPD